MHGIIYNQLFKFIRENHGNDTLSDILREAGLHGKFYDATKSHPDEDLVKILDVVMQKTGASRGEILEGFGFYIAGGLMTTYKSFVKPDWDALDFLEQTENTMHRAVRSANPDADPPKLTIKRVSPDQISIHYYSNRKMIDLGIGIIKGVVKHYKEEDKIKITTKKSDEEDIVIVKRT